LPERRLECKRRSSVSKALRNWPYLIVALVLAAGVIVFVYQSTGRQYATAARLTALLPQSDAIVFYADVAALRQCGFLQFLEATKGGQEPDYQRFVSETGFSYQRDLDAVATAAVPNQFYAVARGRFDWQKLIQYAVNHGGKCQNRYCWTPSSQSGKWLSFFPIQSEVIGVAVSPDRQAAYSLLPREGSPDTQTVNFPVWAKIPQRILTDPTSLPPAAQVMARALSSASSVIVGANQASPTAPGSALDVRLIAGCDSETIANNLRDHLTQLARMFRGMAAHNPPAAGSPDLGRLLASGTFLVDGHTLLGDWIVPRSVIDSLFE
jgi:hypothetical protein